MSCTAPARFLLYTREDTDKMNWTLGNGCNSQGALGDLHDPDLFGFTPNDYKDACDDSSKWEFTQWACDYYKYQIRASEKVVNPKPPTLAGIALSDLNNDGFIDIALSYNNGYMKIFTNTKPRKSPRNRFISFILIGSPTKKVNKYGIGSTLILTTQDENGNLSKQFREVNSYQHHTDHYASKDDRIIFGLGQKMIPVNLSVQWPNGKTSSKSLLNWKPSNALKPHIVYYEQPYISSAHVVLLTLPGKVIPLVGLLLLVLFLKHFYGRHLTLNNQDCHSDELDSIINKDR